MRGPDVEPLIRRCLEGVEAGTVDVYNEAGFQHELGFLLRASLPGWKVELERNVSHFGLDKARFVKREIDLCIHAPENRHRVAIELKVPMNGQVPEQMYAACKDIRFLEQLVDEGGFTQGFFLLVSDDPSFRRGAAEGIYRFFRSGTPLAGAVPKPTGSRAEAVTLAREYLLRWAPVGRTFHACLVGVAPRPEAAVPPV